MKLYELDAELRQAEAMFEAHLISTEGEIDDKAEKLEELLNEAQMNLDDKLLGVGCWIKNLRADSAALKAEIDSLSKRKKTINNKVESLEEWLSYALNGRKLKDSRCVLSWRTSIKVEVTVDPENLPAQFRKVEYKADKQLIKKELEIGHEVPFAKLITNNNLQVR